MARWTVQPMKMKLWHFWRLWDYPVWSLMLGGDSGFCLLQRHAQLIADRHNVELAFVEQERDAYCERLHEVRAELADYKARLEKVVACLQNPYWIGLPYEPAIVAVQQVADKAIAIAEGRAATGQAGRLTSLGAEP